jgi:hypothetical protein
MNPAESRDVRLVVVVLCDGLVSGVVPGVCVFLIVCDLGTSSLRRPRHEFGCYATGLR